MLTKKDYEIYSKKAVEFLEKAHIAVTEKEKARIEVAEYDLGCIDKIGLELVVYVNTERCCAKELVLLPFQTCPEHRHPYVEGENSGKPAAQIPAGMEGYFTCRKEIVLKPGEQYTIQPNTLHWFQAGKEGAVVSEFSTKSRDEYDIYTDPRIDPAGKRQV